MNILCFGDDITAGYYNYGKNFHPYKLHLEKQLSNSRIDHIGLSGFTSDEMIKSSNDKQIDDYLNNSWIGLEEQLKVKNYDYCIILAGTNDVLETEIDKSILRDIFKVHAIVHEHKTKTIALTIPKMNLEELDKDITTIRNTINNELINTHNFSNKNYKVIDIASFIGDNFEFMDKDGIHFTPEGYDKIGEYIAKCILKLEN